MPPSAQLNPLHLMKPLTLAFALLFLASSAFAATSSSFLGASSSDNQPESTDFPSQPFPSFSTANLRRLLLLSPLYRELAEFAIASFLQEYQGSSADVMFSADPNFSVYYVGSEDGAELETTFGVDIEDVTGRDQSVKLTVLYDPIDNYMRLISYTFETN